MTKELISKIENIFWNNQKTSIHNPVKISKENDNFESFIVINIKDPISTNLIVELNNLFNKDGIIKWYEKNLIIKYKI